MKKAKEQAAQKAAGKAHQQQMLSNTAVTAGAAKSHARKHLRHGAVHSCHEEVTGEGLAPAGPAADGKNDVTEEKDEHN